MSFTFNSRLSQTPPTLNPNPNTYDDGTPNLRRSYVPPFTDLRYPISYSMHWQGGVYTYPDNSGMTNEERIFHWIWLPKGYKITLWRGANRTGESVTLEAPKDSGKVFFSNISTSCGTWAEGTNGLQYPREWFCGERQSIRSWETVNVTLETTEALARRFPSATSDQCYQIFQMEGFQRSHPSAISICGPKAAAEAQTQPPPPQTSSPIMTIAPGYILTSSPTPPPPPPSPMMTIAPGYILTGRPTPPPQQMIEAAKLKAAEDMARGARNPWECYTIFNRAGFSEEHPSVRSMCLAKEDALAREAAQARTSQECYAIFEKNWYPRTHTKAIEACTPKYTAEQKVVEQCARFEEGATILDSTTGSLYKVESGKMRRYPTLDLYRSWGEPPYQTRGSEVQACPQGPLMGFPMAKPTSLPTPMPTPMPTSTPTVVLTQKPKPTCPPLEEGSVVLDSSTGTVFKVESGLLRSMNSDIYRSWGTPQYTQTISGASARVCRKGPPMDGPKPTPTPLPIVSSTPTAAPLSPLAPAPQFLKAPNTVVFVHKATWMQRGILKVMTQVGGDALALEPYEPMQPTQAFTITAQGEIKNVDGHYVLSTDACTSVGHSVTGPGERWAFGKNGASPLEFTLTASCGKMLGSEPIGNSPMVTLDASEPMSSWFIIPVGRLRT